MGGYRNTSKISVLSNALHFSRLLRFSFAQRIDNKIENPIISKTFSRIHVYCANPRCQRTVAIVIDLREIPFCCKELLLSRAKIYLILINIQIFIKDYANYLIISLINF